MDTDHKPLNIQAWLGKQVKEVYMVYKGYKKKQGERYDQTKFANDLGYEDSKVVRDAFKGNMSALLAIRLSEFIDKPPKYFLLGEPCELRKAEYAAYCANGKDWTGDTNREVINYRFRQLKEKILTELDMDTQREFLAMMERQLYLYTCMQRENHKNKEKKEDHKMNRDDEHVS